MYAFMMSRLLLNRLQRSKDYHFLLLKKNNHENRQQVGIQGKVI